MFALLFVPALGLLACAIDYSRAVTARTALQSAADNANFAAIGSSSEGYKAAMAMTANGSVPLAIADAKSFFDNQASLVKGVSEVSRTVNVTKTNGTVSSTISFSAKIGTSFGGVVHMPTVTVSNTTTATNGIPVFQDFYLLLDSSPSMGVGATTADIATMVNNTPDKCAFACHDLSNSNNYYNLAKRLGVKTRMDVLREATQQLFTSATNMRTNPEQFGMAIDTFDVGLHSISSVTTDMTSASASATAIDVMPVPSSNWNNDQDTNFYPAFDGMNSLIPTPGTGASVNSRQKVLFFVSDGVSDYNNNGKRTYEPISAALCKEIKDRGIQIAVLYTPYLPLPTNAWYNTYISPFQPTVGPSMQACASPGLYFAVGPNQGIADAMNALFQKVVGMAHLTQ